MPGLNAISGRVDTELASWLKTGDYQFYDPIQPTSFSLAIADRRPMLAAFAYDCSRMAMSSIESIVSVREPSALPRTTAWLLIQTYYSAFFGAQSILRMLGTSCTQIEQDVANRIYDVANAFGCTPSVPSLAKGYYECSLDTASGKLRCSNMAVKGGSHEAFWKVFNSRVKAMSSEILTRGSFPAWDQPVSIKLADLSENLCAGGRNDGSWLSFIRNEVNYRQRYATWYPYRNRPRCYDDLHTKLGEWKSDPMDIDLVRRGQDPMIRFLNTCQFLVGLCRVMTDDMAQRCPNGMSFHHYGAQAILNVVRPRA